MRQSSDARGWDARFVRPTPDVAVVGGGIVGLATALALLEERGVGRVLVLEAEEAVARHQSGRNSGIIHSGLYYRPGSAKARLCAEGRADLYEFCTRHRVPFSRTGKLVVATDPVELDELERLAERGKANGLRGLEMLDRPRLGELEPEVAGVAALHVQETGIVDFAEVTRTMARLVGQDLRGEVRTGCRVLAAREEGGVVRLQTAAGELEAGALVNCAGLQADRLARAVGVRPPLRIVPFRGDYYQVRPERTGVLSRPVYPVPDPALPFLGVHLHPTLDGRLEAGPNAVLSLDRNGYSPFAVDLRDALDVVAFPGFWRLAARHWRSGLEETLRALSRRRFVEAVRRLVPSLTPGDLRRARAGLRAQAVDRQGRLLDDFHLEEGEQSIHVLNSPSPAATASLAIGRKVARRVVEALE